MWLSLLGQLVCRECCGYYFALLIHWLSEDVIFPPYYLRLATSCVLGSICPASFLVCATCNPFLHLPLTAPGADWPKLFCSHLWDESVLWYFLSRLQAHKSSRKRDDFALPSRAEPSAHHNLRFTNKWEQYQLSLMAFPLRSSTVLLDQRSLRYCSGCAKAPNLTAYLQTHLGNM